MPIALWFFFISTGVALSYDLPKLAHGRDANVRLKTNVEDDNYYIKVAQSSKHKDTECKGTIIAISTRKEPVRLQINGEEQMLDTSWSYDWKLLENEELQQRVVFLDTVTQQQLACRTAFGTCGYRYARHFTTGSCDPKGGNENRDKRRKGAPRLAVRAPHFVMGNVIYGGTVPVTIYVEVLGEITDEFWCPEVIVRWPDHTESIRESDCDPFTPDKVGAEQSWRFTHHLESKENRIEVLLMRYGKQIAKETVFVKVSGQ